MALLAGDSASCEPPGQVADYREATRRWLERSAERWTTNGLGYSTVRLRDGGQVIGAGGAQRHRSGTWNLEWQVATTHRRRGYATELGRAAHTAAVSVDPDVAVIAWIGEANTPSHRVAERVGPAPPRPAARRQRRVARRGVRTSAARRQADAPAVR